MNDILFTPKNIGTCEIKNRIIMAPMLMGFANLDGTPTNKLLDYYEERAKGGTGLIITEITRVNDKHGSAAFAQLSASSDENIEGLSKLAERIHKHNSKVFVQLHHPGRQNIGLLVGTVPLSIKAENLTKGLYSKILFKLTPSLGPMLIKKNITPSSVAPSKCEPAYFSGGKVRELTHDEILELEQNFIDAAVRVKKSGCDGIELHASHGYLFQQFFSPVTNKRTDEYGGSFENRMRFIKNIITGIREKCGDFPLVVRLTVDEFYDKIGQKGKGYNLEEGLKIAKALEDLGVDAIDVSSAGYDTFNYWLEPVSFECGWRKYLAKAVKDVVSIPVIAANLIRSSEQAAAQIEEGTQDFISLGRPHIADPHWANKAQNGDTINRCICCLNCIESMQNNAYIGYHGECAVNPYVGKENTNMRINGRRRKIVIAGSGPAGLVAAYLLAKRDFDVTIIEKSTKIGGQLNLTSASPSKEKIGWFIEDYKNLCDENGVEFRLNTIATPEIIEEYNPWAVILATGIKPIKPIFDGKYEYKDLLTFEDILSGKITPENKKVAVIGSGMTGLETAEYLNDHGCKTIVIEMASSVAPGTWMQHVDDIIPRLKNAGTEIYTNEKLISVFPDKIITKNTITGENTEHHVDMTVLALGTTPDNSLKDELNGKVKRLFSIGDCTKPGRIADATKAAFELVKSII